MFVIIISYSFKIGTFLPEYLYYNDEFIQDVDEIEQDHFYKIQFPVDE